MPLPIFAVVLPALALVLLVTARSAWRDRRRLGSLVGLLAATLCLALAALCGSITPGIRGYRALTREVVAAPIKTEPLGPQRFPATLPLPDSRPPLFRPPGDAGYLDVPLPKGRPRA